MRLNWLNQTNLLFSFYFCYYFVDQSDYGIHVKELSKVTTVSEYFTCLEEHNVLGRNNLMFIKYIACEMQKEKAVEAIDNYARNLESLPLVVKRPEKQTHGKFSVYVDIICSE